MANETWNGATRVEFIERVKGLSKREIADMMRKDGKRVPQMAARSTYDDFVGACFDVLVGKDSGPATAAPPSTPSAAGAPRFEIRSKGVERRYRCGHAFTNQPRPFAQNAFSRDEWELLKADPLIEIRDLTRQGAR